MNILITGGTGSFGQACVEHLLKNDTYSGKILIYSRDEHKQEAMVRKFKELDKNERLRFFIGDIRDKDRLYLSIREANYIIHAAALKVVPIAEYNPFEYVKTNILGTQNLIDCCLNAYNKGTHISLIALSTDKAVNPINLYGATKLCMEKIILAANNIHGEYGPKFNVVRYGNVANSNGSVIQIFKEQLRKGMPITVTDPNMTRFWITLEEAVKFVLQTFSDVYLGNIRGGVFIPEMPSFKIGELVSAFKTTYPDLESRLIGIRLGEKLHEQIDVNKFSNSNLHWIGGDELKAKLREMGVI